LAASSAFTLWTLRRVGVDENDPPVFESQVTYLKLHGLLLAVRNDEYKFLNNRCRAREKGQPAEIAGEGAPWTPTRLMTPKLTTRKSQQRGWTTSLLPRSYRGCSRWCSRSCEGCRQSSREARHQIGQEDEGRQSCSLRCQAGEESSRKSPKENIQEVCEENKIISQTKGCRKEQNRKEGEEIETLVFPRNRKNGPLGRAV
jgi:hypothetical protein